jgi:WD40 repeat protein
VCPFKGLAPFETEDAEFFFGRERLVDELRARVRESPLLAIIGPSGSGKSSLLRAGLVPALGLDAVVVRPGEALPEREDVVVAVDHFEELFAPAVGEEERRAFVEALVEKAWDPERRSVVLVAMRADFFGRLAPYVELADLVGPNHVLLGPMSAAELRRAVEGPAARAGLTVEPGLVDALVDDVAGEAGGLPLLSTALAELWHERDGRSLTLAAYERTGGVHGVVGRHAETAFSTLSDDERAIARRVFLRLVSDDGDSPTRRRATWRELGAEDDERVARVIATLVERRLLVADDGSVELVHEALLERWPRLAEWLEEDTYGRRTLRHLARAASEWEARGRDAGDLYRGTRLVAALDWADGSGADLNRLEREFLEVSRTAFARANRRLRTLLAAAVLLLAAALAAGALALVARGTAKEEATVAIAQRLGAQALVEPRLDRALLLAREGANLHDSTATRSNLLATLLRSPAALAVLHGGGTRVVDDALSRDGHLLVARSDGSAAFFDTSTLRELRPPFAVPGDVSKFGAIVRPVRALALSGDGRRLAVGDSDGHVATLALVDTRTRRRVWSTKAARDAATADVVFSPDGRTIVAGEITSGRYRDPSEVLVERRASDGKELGRSKPIPAARVVGFVADSRLLVTSGERTSYLLDPRTFARVRTLHESGVAAVAPGGETVAFGADDGTVVLVGLRTGARRSMSSRASARVTAAAFSDDGETLATAAEDGVVSVWDVSTRSLRETFAGHAAASRGLLFAPDGATLYSASADGTVIVWDVRGSRRLGRPFIVDPVATKASTAVAVSADSSTFATSPAPGRVTLRRTRDVKPIGELRGPCGYVDELEWSHDGRLAGAACDRRFAVVWDVATRKVLRLLGPAGPQGTSGLAFSPNDRLVATAGADGLARLYELQSGRLVGAFGEKPYTFQAVDFSSDGRWLTAAGLGTELFVWNVAAHRVEHRIHDDHLHLSIKFAPTGSQFAVGDDAGNVTFWDAENGRRVGPTLGGHNGLVLSATYDPSGRQLITTSSDGKLRLWDIASAKLVGAPLPGAATGGWGTFFPDGKSVIAVFSSGAGVVWNVDPAAWKTAACRIAHRQLTRSEWHDFLPERAYGTVCP